MKKKFLRGAKKQCDDDIIEVILLTNCVLGMKIHMNRKEGENKFIVVVALIRVLSPLIVLQLIIQMHRNLKTS